MDAWIAFKSWLDRSAPALAATLRPGAEAEELDGIQRVVGHSLPPSVRAWWSACGGQREMDGPGVAGGFVLLSPHDALAQWAMWAGLRAAETEEGMHALRSQASSRPRGTVQEQYTLPGWIPLWRERGEANYVGIDLDPGPQGVVGQVINFGRDEDDKRVLFWDYADAIAWLAAQAQANRLAVRDGGLELDGGRLLSVLGRFAEQEGVWEKKPALAPKAPARPLPDETDGPIGPEPIPTHLPAEAQEALDGYVEKLREVLAEHTGPQTEAYCNHEFEPANDPRAAALGGDALRMVPFKPPVARKKLPPEDDVRAIAALSHAAGLTVRRLEIRFTRSEKEWRHAFSIETPENHRRLYRARKALDAEIAAALKDAMATREDGEKAWLTYERDPVSKLAVTIKGSTSRDVAEARAPLCALFERVEQLHARFGMRLRTASWSVQTDSPTKVMVQTYYG